MKKCGANCKYLIFKKTYEYDWFAYCTVPYFPNSINIIDTEYEECMQNDIACSKWKLKIKRYNG